MHTALQKIKDAFGGLIDELQAVITSNEPMGIAHDNWGWPAVTRNDLIHQARSLVRLIDERGCEQVDTDSETYLEDIPRRIEFLTTKTVPNLWGNAGAGVQTYTITMDAIRRVLEHCLRVGPDELARAEAALRQVTQKIRSLEARIENLTPRADGLSEQIKVIESAHAAAEQLPVDQQALAEARSSIRTTLAEVLVSQNEIKSAHEAIKAHALAAKDSAKHAEDASSRCDTAYAIATSQGLAAAFERRSQSLAMSMWGWVSGLVVALAVGMWYGRDNLANLMTLLSAGASIHILLIQSLLSVVSLGAPLWLAWLATKQIGQRFRLSEDYAFKASISQAYEGYRREAVRVGGNLEESLLRSALDRLDELPLRLIEPASHGSPWHEALSSDAVKQAFKSVPDFAKQVTNLAHNVLAKPEKASSASTTVSQSQTPGSQQSISQ